MDIISKVPLAFIVLKETKNVNKFMTKGLSCFETLIKFEQKFWIDCIINEIGYFQLIGLDEETQALEEEAKNLLKKLSDSVQANHAERCSQCSNFGLTGK